MFILPFTVFCGEPIMYLPIFLGYIVGVVLGYVSAIPKIKVILVRNIGVVRALPFMPMVVSVFYRNPPFNAVMAGVTLALGVVYLEIVEEKMKT